MTPIKFEILSVAIYVGLYLLLVAVTEGLTQQELTQNTEKHRVGLGVPLQVADDAGVVPGLLPPDPLQDQTLSADN